MELAPSSAHRSPLAFALVPPALEPPVAAFGWPSPARMPPPSTPPSGPASPLPPGSSPELRAFAAEPAGAGPFDVGAEQAALRRLVVALALAMRLEDRGVAAAVAARLWRAASRAERWLAGEARGLPAGASAAIRAHLRAAERLLAAAPTEVSREDLHRLQRWMTAPPSLGAAGSRADLFDLDGRGKNLELAALSQLHLLSCRLAGARLARASFAHAVVDACDLSSADAYASRWRSALVLRGQLAGISLAEADLSGAIFSDCDLRGADLSALTGGAGGEGAMWIRCDLRDSTWRGRRLENAHFVACRLDGVRELALADTTTLVRCEPALDEATVRDAAALAGRLARPARAAGPIASALPVRTRILSSDEAAEVRGEVEVRGPGTEPMLPAELFDEHGVIHRLISERGAVPGTGGRAGRERVTAIGHLRPANDQVANDQVLAPSREDAAA